MCSRLITIVVIVFISHLCLTFTQSGKKRLPDALIIGAQKCGTTSLSFFLDGHPGVQFAEYNGSELNFFTDDNFRNGFKWYRHKMPLHLPGSLLLAKDTLYFNNPKAPERVYDMNPDIKLIVIVCDPTTRLVSLFEMVKSWNVFPPNFTFEKWSRTFAVRGSHFFHDFEYGKYAHHLRKWLHIFPRRNILIVDGAKFKDSPSTVLSGVERFLNLTQFFSVDKFVLVKRHYCLKVEEGAAQCLPESVSNVHSSVEPSVIAHIRQLYSNYNKKFYKLVGRDYGWV